MIGERTMKIELQYRDHDTQIPAYIFNAVYDAKDVREAREERDAAERNGYEITIWRLVPDDKVTLL